MTQSSQDQFEIQQLLYRYADAADRRDVEAYCACFLDRQVQVSGPGYELDDGHHLIGLLRERFDWTMHNVHNHLYRIEGSAPRVSLTVWRAIWSRLSVSVWICTSVTKMSCSVAVMVGGLSLAVCMSVISTSLISD